MTCTHVRIPGGVAIVCTPRERPRRCSCGCGRRAELLCDHPNGGGRGGTCDKAIARACAVELGDDRHLCPQHKETARQGSLAL